MCFITKKAPLILTFSTIISVFSYTVNASWADDELAKGKAALKKAAKNCNVTHETATKENSELFSLAEFAYKRLKNKNDKGLNDLIDNRLCGKQRMEKQMMSTIDRDNDYFIKPQDSVCFSGQATVVKNHLDYVNDRIMGFPDEERRNKAAMEACKKFYGKKYFGKTWRIQNDLDKRMKAEKKKEKARQASVATSKDEQYAEILKSLNIPSEQLVTWKVGLAREYINNSSGDVKRHINAMNKDMGDQSNPNNKVVSFIKPSKGEFEKTADYEKRVIEARDKHDAKNKKRMDDVREKSSGIRVKVFNTYFGNPKTSDIKYDADNEIFTLKVKSSAFSYEISGYYKAPIASAKDIKGKLAVATPTVLFLMTDDHIAPKAVVLSFPDKLVMLADINEGSQTILIGDDILERWNSTLKKEKGERNEQYAAQAAAKRSAIKARNAKYGHHGEYLKDGALVCIDMKDMYKLMTIRRIGSMAAEPAGCMASNGGLQPITDRSSDMGGVTKVWIKSTGIPVFTRTQDIID